MQIFSPSLATLQLLVSAISKRKQSLCGFNFFGLLGLVLRNSIPLVRSVTDNSALLWLSLAASRSADCEVVTAFRWLFGFTFALFCLVHRASASRRRLLIGLAFFRKRWKTFGYWSLSIHAVVLD